MAKQLEDQKIVLGSVSEGEKLLYQLNKLLSRHNVNKLDQELLNKLSQYSQKIMRKRRKEKMQTVRNTMKKEDIKQRASPSEVIEEYDESVEKSISLKRQQRIKPSHLKNLAATFTEKLIAENLLQFLEVGELLQARLISRKFSLACDKYFPFALQREADSIYRELEDEAELNAQYMEVVQTQIPISTNDWLKLELANTEECCLSKWDITNLKAIKKVPQDKDIIFAPFCILNKLEPTRLPTTVDSVQYKNVSWHASALKFIIKPNFLPAFSSFRRDNLPEPLVLEAFEYLNMEELQVDKVTQFNASLGNLVRWCQSIVAYHIITHPYKLRNFRTVPKDSELFEFVKRIDKKMEDFYAFKDFLLVTDKISKKTNFAFNLRHTNFLQKAMNVNISSLGNKEMKAIFQYLTPKEVITTRLVSKRWADLINEHWGERLIQVLQDIEASKMANMKQLIPKLPALYEYGFFIKAVQMLDFMLYSDYLFFSRTHLEDIKGLKKFNETINNLFQALLLLLNIKPVRKMMPSGEMHIDYFSPIHELLVKKRFIPTLKKLDKYWIDYQMLIQLEEMLNNPEKKLSLKSVKVINIGLYQLLLWIRAVVMLNKLINPLLFMDVNYIKKRLLPEELLLVEDLNQAIESWKMMYSIHLRTNNGQSTFESIIEQTKKNLASISEEFAVLGKWEASNKIASFYFTAKDQIPPGAHPALVEKVLSEFFNEFKELDPFGFETIHFTLTGPVFNQQTEQSNVTAADILKTVKTSKKNINIDASLLDHKVMATSLLFYMEIGELRSCSLVNKHWNKGVKMHAILRAIKIIEETKEYQEDNRQISERIHEKRMNYHKDYELPAPTKESAIERMSVLEAKDISNLRAVKKASAGYEFFIAPFVILFGREPEIKWYANGTKEISYWKAARKIWVELSFYQRIKEFPVELIPTQRIKKMQEYLTNTKYTIEEARKINPSLSNFVSWIMGVNEFHQYLRKYCERDMDKEILDEVELEFLHDMDSKMFNNFKIFKFVAEKCGEYKELPFIAQELATHPSLKLAF